MFLWPLGADFLAWTAAGPGCPCLECFEVLNPKMFDGRGKPPRILPDALISDLRAFVRGAFATGRVRFSTPRGPVETHPITPASKCPARLVEEGFRITP